MPGATVIHAACFAVGAIVGGGTVAAVSLSRQRQPVPVPVPSKPGSTTAVVAPGPPPSPLIQVESKGLTDLTRTAEKLPGTVLKYGNPGAFHSGSSDEVLGTQISFWRE